MRALLRDLAARVDLMIEAGDVAELQTVGKPPCARAQLKFGLLDLLGQMHELIGDLRAFTQAGRQPERDVKCRERSAERLAVADVARDCDRVAAEWLAFLPL